MDIFNKPLALAYQQYEESWQKSRPKLLFSDAKEATNCPTYFQLKSSSHIQETLSNMSIKRGYLICDALKVLKTARAVDGSTKINNSVNLIMSKLDLRSFESSLYQQSTQEKHTLKSLFPNIVLKKGSKTVSIKTSDWSYKFEVVASALINNNTKPDWILWFYDEALQGNYRSYQTLVILDPDTNSIFKASRK